MRRLMPPRLKPSLVLEKWRASMEAVRDIVGSKSNVKQLVRIARVLGPREGMLMAPYRPR